VRQQRAVAGEGVPVANQGGLLAFLDGQLPLELFQPVLLVGLQLVHHRLHLLRVAAAWFCENGFVVHSVVGF